MTTAQRPAAKPNPQIFGTLKDDLRRGDFSDTIRRDFQELKEYMLEEERQKRLREMGRVKRWILLSWWLLKSMFFKLTPARRLLFVLGMLMIVLSRTVIYSDKDIDLNIDLNGIGIAIILFVLMLELKDKLIAHDELRAGRAVQLALMPEETPRVPGWDLWLTTRSANEVGGDLVDFIRLTDQRCAVAIGDVAGKGLSAALLMAKLQATLRALAADSTSLSGLGAKLNRIFCRDSPKSMFASLAYIELTLGSGSVRLMNAGHLPPVLLRKERIKKTEKGGVALGIMPGATFDQQVMELEKGDLLLAYSDGLTEAQNASGEFYGEQRLYDVVLQLTSPSAKQCGERLIADVGRFVGEGKSFDDLSIVVAIRV